MDVQVQILGYKKLQELVASLGPSNRSRLHSIAAKNLEVKIRQHIARYAPHAHRTAMALGATPTGHYRRGLAGITSQGNAEYGEVMIPIPGISRAFGDITISTPTERGKKYLTIPCHALSYGHTVGEMSHLGWKLFRPGKAKILLGYRDKKDKPIKLFILASKVTLRADKSLLPTQEQLQGEIVRSVALEINRRITAAKGAQ